ncbi:MAG: hypothetical protein K2Y27_20140 [Xanthobacteraceae bacterium]|nr:hypothetical protein [Xanthobacteraceae bacterium]
MTTKIPRNPTTLVDDEGVPVPLTSLPALGALTNTKVTDPDAASATIPALLRGILAELKAQTLLLTDIKTNTTPT